MADPVTILTIAATAVSAAGTLAAGGAARADADFQAKQMEARGKEEIAASQREAEETRRNSQLLQSRQQAVAAASGAGTGGSALETMLDTNDEGELQALTALYGGEMRKRGLQDQAAASRRSGKAAQVGSYFKAGSTILSGAGSAYKSYKTGGYG